MNLDKQAQQIEIINSLKSKKKFSDVSVVELSKQVSFNGITEFKFNGLPFYMLNIAKDDGVVLKYLWRDKYEKMSLNLWYKITREDGYCIDIGAHTGIYSIIGSLNKKIPLMLSFEPYFLNFARLIDNLKINSLKTKHCYLAAVSNQKGSLKFEVPINGYHSAGGRISDEGNLPINAIMIDDINFKEKVVAIKIDTEGHEFNVIEGAQKTIQNNKPEIIFEINKNSFNSCANLLKKFKYKFYLINEELEKFVEIEKFDENFTRIEGTNCYATVKGHPLIL